jgi:protein TonB
MSAFRTPPPKKSRHRWVIGGMLGIVLMGGIASFIFSAGEKTAVEKPQDYQIVDVTIPPPPPPPPPPEDVIKDPEEIEESVEPLEMTAGPDTPSDDSSEVDLGIDIGDLATSTGSGFVMDIPRFGKHSRGGGGDDSLNGGGMDSPPSPVTKTQPAYPSSLLKKGVGGKVLISCVVDVSGQVISASVKQSSGHPELDKAALNAVNKWKFKPGVKSGKSSKATCVVPFNFEVKKA